MLYSISRDLIALLTKNLVLTKFSNTTIIGLASYSSSASLKKIVNRT